MLRLVALAPPFLALRGAVASGGPGEGAPDPRRLSSGGGPPTCVRIHNGPADHDPSGGSLGVRVFDDAGSGHHYADAVAERSFGPGTVVLEACYASLRAVQVFSEHGGDDPADDDGWDGFVAFSDDGGTTYGPGICVEGCEGGDPRGGAVDVRSGPAPAPSPSSPDGDDDAGAATRCPDGRRCVLVPVANLARGRPAEQGPRTLYGAVASRAVDGNVDGAWANGSVTHTGGDLGVMSHWTVTLDDPNTRVERVKVWNRTDRTGCEFSHPDGDCRRRLVGATLALLDGAGNVVVERTFGEAVDVMEVDFTDGQYRASRVRVRLPPQSDNMSLSLAEVEVLGYVPPPVCYADAAASHPGHCVSNTGRLASGGYREAGRAPTFDECAAFCAPPRGAGGGARLLGLAYGTAGSNACHCYFDAPTADPGFEVSFDGDPGNAGRIEGGNGVAAECRPRVECAAPTPAPTGAPTISLDPTCTYYPRYPEGRCVCEIRCPAGQSRYGDGSACTGGGFPNCDLGICHNNPNSLPTCSTAQEYLAPPVTPPPVTTAPTAAPTSPPPTSAPTPAPWSLIFTELISGFGRDDANEIVLIFEIGRGRDFDSHLYAGGCGTGSPPGDAINVTYSKSNATVPSDPSMSTLALNYDFDKATLARSNVWNGEDEALELCHVAQLTHTTDDGDTLVIVEDIRNITVGINFTVDYSVDNITLAGAVIDSNNDTVSTDSYINAYHCDGRSMNEASSDLGPNDVLYVCLESLSTSVEIANVDRMAIEGTAPGGTASRLEVVGADGPLLPSLTSVEYLAGARALVSTRLPINRFNFRDEGAFVSVEGALTTRLAGSGGGRRLDAGAVGAARRTQEDGAEDEASFEVVVGLRSEEAVAENSFVVPSSGHTIAGKGVVAVLLVAGLGQFLC